jgi:hypothetical protein
LPSITESEQQRYGLKICENELLLLGVFIGKKQSQCNELNWRGKINKIKALLNMWLQRTLTIQGRISDLLLLILAPEHLPYNSNILNTSSIDCLLDTVTVVSSAC